MRNEYNNHLIGKHDLKNYFYDRLNKLSAISINNLYISIFAKQNLTIHNRITFTYNRKIDQLFTPSIHSKSVLIHILFGVFSWLASRFGTSSCHGDAQWLRFTFHEVQVWVQLLLSDAALDWLLQGDALELIVEYATFVTLGFATEDSRRFCARLALVGLGARFLISKATLVLFVFGNTLIHIINDHLYVL